MTDDDAAAKEAAELLDSEPCICGDETAECCRDRIGPAVAERLRQLHGMVEILRAASAENARQAAVARERIAALEAARYCDHYVVIQKLRERIATLEAALRSVRESHQEPIRIIGVVDAALAGRGMKVGTGETRTERPEK